ncbi:S8 family serine peptidase [Pelagicoccus enzymogenes]|uniref:S8 family serine peptidase n=1 Tax=Pelagicoccus enzymogenes TaxID=2773457 RepID=UPI00280F49D0|nr:S8 family serine peptidase [Pelagicoccus enzymogenes]MDQ8199218.1 S8 family serine peptidase [Pelagicoccus enzymogenes]
MMKSVVKLALAPLAIFSIAAIVLWCSQTRRSPLAGAEPEAAQRESDVPRETPGPAEVARDAQVLEEASSTIPTPSLLPPGDWSGATVLSERLEAAGLGSERYSLRHRIVEDEGFPFPIRITDRIAVEESGEPRKLSELSAYAANQIILHSSSPITEGDIEDIANSLGWTYLKSEGTPYMAVLESSTADLDTVTEALAAVSLSDSSIEAEPNHIFYASLVPNDPRFESGLQWGLDHVDDVDIDAPEGWEIRRQSPSITVAILDTGIRLDHEDLKANLWTNSGDSTRNGIDDDKNGYVDDTHGFNALDPLSVPDDDHGHGTHIAGIVGAAGNNAKGMSGVAWSINLMPIKALNANGKGTAQALAAGIDYAVANGAQIINMSWGANSFSGVIESSIGRAEEAGVIVVAAAGNESSETPAYPSRSELPNVVSVGAVGSSGELSWFSNFHPSLVDVLAPGQHIFSTWSSAPDAYIRQDGTSMATAFASGSMALFLEEYPDDDYTLQIQRLVSTCQKWEGLAQYCASGGIVNLRDGLLADEVTFPPVVTQTSARYAEAYEGESVSFSVSARSDSPITYRWYEGDELLSESSSTLSLESILPSQRGEYRLEISNAEATTTVFYNLEVFPRMDDIEQALGSGIKVYASHEDHWRLVSEEGLQLISSGNLSQDKQQFLEFRVPVPGLLYLTARKNHIEEAATNTTLIGPNGFDVFLGAGWETLRSITEQGGFTARITHRAVYPETALPQDSLQLQIPEFFESDKLPPLIVGDMYSRSVALGKGLELTVWSTQENLTYQWFKDGQAIEGATSRILKIDAVTESDGGDYYVVATNLYDSTRSKTATIEIDTSPQRPSSQIEGSSYLLVKAGDPINLSMKVFGALPIEHQWYKNGVLIPGAETNVLRLGAASLAHSGEYELVLTNELGSATGYRPKYTVQVYEEIFPPRFPPVPFDEEHYSFPIGSTMGFEVPQAEGSPQLTYQWYKDGEAIENEAISNAHLFSKADVGWEDAGTYYAEASNGLGNNQSHRIVVNVTPVLIEAIDAPSETIVGETFTGAEDAYVNFQTAESWDGEDALELYSKRSRESLTLGSKEYDRVLKFRWKLNADSDAVFEAYLGNRYGSDFLFESHESGRWVEQQFFIPAEHSLRLRLDPGALPAKAWLDNLEEVRSPVVLRDIHFTPPAVGKNVSLEASFFRNGATYQWYKDNQPISGQTESVLTIGSFSQANSGNYKLVATNAHGEASTSAVYVGLDSLASIAPSPLKLSYDGSPNPKVSLEKTSPTEDEHHLRIENSSPGDLDTSLGWSLSSQVTGPAVLEMDYDFSSTNAHIEVGDAEMWIPTGFRFERQVFIPAGTHTLSISTSDSYQSNVGKIYSLKLRSGPLAKMRLNEELHYNEQYVPFATYAGAEPLTVSWYKDGALLKKVSNLISGESYPFERDSGIADRGDYYIEVEDSLGNKSTSDTVHYALGSYMREVLDSSSGGLNLSDSEPATYHYDTDIKTKGSASLRIDGPFGDGNPYSLRLTTSAYYARLKIRTRGFPEGGYIHYSLDGETISIPANGEWTDILVGPGVSVTLPESTEQSSVWIDDLRDERKGMFITHPQNTATYIGARIELKAHAREGNIYFLGLRWFRDGKEIPSQGAHLLIDPVTEQDLGVYHAEATSPNGEVIASETATVSLLESGLAEAIGFPGARITTIGPKPWQVDFSRSLEGPSSIVSGSLETGETSTIVIDVDPPSIWSIYSYLSSLERVNDEPQANRWMTHHSRRFGPTNTQRIELSVSEFEENGGPLNRSLRLDRARVIRLPELSYENWLRSKATESTSPPSESRFEPLGDVDGDGISNWMEFVLGLEPTEESALPTWNVSKVTAQSPTASIRFLSARSREYSISYEISYDLAEWFPVRPELQTQSVDDHYDETIATLPFLSETYPYFIRWRIHRLGEEDQGIMTLFE